MIHKSFITTNIILYCEEWEETVKFYKEHLQLPVNFYNDWFVEFCLTSTSRLSVADKRRSSIESCEGKGITLAIETGDIEAAWKYAEMAGLSPTPVKKHPWNAKVFNIFDPEGHRIEMWQKLNTAEAP